MCFRRASHISATDTSSSSMYRNGQSIYTHTINMTGFTHRKRNTRHWVDEWFHATNSQSICTSGGHHLPEAGSRSTLNPVQNIIVLWTSCASSVQSICTQRCEGRRATLSLGTHIRYVNRQYGSMIDKSYKAQTASTYTKTNDF